MDELVPRLFQGRCGIFDNPKKQARPDRDNNKKNHVAHAIRNLQQVQQICTEVVDHHSSPRWFVQILTNRHIAEPWYNSVRVVTLRGRAAVGFLAHATDAVAA